MKKLLLSLVMLLPVTLVKAQTLPNPGFENWNVVNYDDLNDWYNSNRDALQGVGAANVTKVTGVGGISTNAVRLETINSTNGDMPAYITNTDGDPTNGEGGIPFTGTPAGMTLKGDFRYNISTLDSAVLLIVFKKNSQVIAVDTVFITGSQPTFTAKSFALPNMAASSVTPDSMIFAAVSTNIFGTGLLAPGFLEMDDLYLENLIGVYMINGMFENWTAKTHYGLNDWDYYGDVKRSTDKLVGNYSVQLTTIEEFGDTVASDIYTRIEMGQSVDTIAGFYKYATPGGDEAELSIALFDQNQTFLGAEDYTLTPSATYKFFKFPINPGALNGAAYIDFYSSSYGAGNQTVGSVLVIDSLHIIKGPLGVKEVFETRKISVYPNPAHDVLTVKLNSVSADVVSIELIDMKGAIVFRNSYKNNSQFAIPVADLPQGQYFYQVTVGPEVFRNKFIKE